MTEITPEETAAIQNIVGLAHALYEAIDSQSTQQILNAQHNLSAAAERIWARVADGENVSNQDKAVVRLLVEGAIKELPQKIQDPANYPQIQRDLRLLKSSLVLLK